MKDLEKLERFDELQGKQIVIYGASPTGVAILRKCLAARLNVLAFCDDNTRKQGVILEGVPVYSYASLSSQHDEWQGLTVLLAMPQMARAMAQLRESKCSQVVAGALLLFPEDYQQSEFDVPGELATRIIETAISCQMSHFEPTGLMIRSLDLVVTERCSLRCRDCANLIQYYKKPVDISLAELQKSMKALCESVDSINEVRVLGGEPFMHKQLAEIVKWLVVLPQVEAVVIYTNATIVPTEEQMQALVHPKVLFSITDYGKLSRGLDMMLDRLREYGALFAVHPAEGWSSCADISRHGRSMHDLREMLQNCCVNDVTTLLRGRLYRCPFIANAMNLGAIPKEREDYIELLALSPVARRNAIKKLLAQERYFVSCDYCNGRYLDAPLIEPAVQLKVPRAYERC